MSGGIRRAVCALIAASGLTLQAFAVSTSAASAVLIAVTRSITSGTISTIRSTVFMAGMATGMTRVMPRACAAGGGDLLILRRKTKRKVFSR